MRAIMVTSLVVGALAVVPLPAQDKLATALAALEHYLVAYEATLSTLVADENYEQSVVVARLPVNVAPPERQERRRLLSTVSFMRLPGGGAWLGLREVRMVNGKASSNGDRLMALLSAQNDDRRARAAALARASAEHNLGNTRTVNMPTLPLEIAHPRHRARMAYEYGGSAFVNGMETIRLNFREREAPTLIRGAKDEFLWSRASIWLEPRTGRIWRGQVWYDDTPVARVGRPSSYVRVEFGNAAAALGIIVPVEMREEFAVPSGRGSGVARYRNFRRFGTSARIIPQP